MAQWQSAGGLSQALGSTPGGTTFLSFSLGFKGIQTVTTQIVFVMRQSLSVFGLWGRPIHWIPHAMIPLTILFVLKILVKHGYAES